MGSNLTSALSNRFKQKIISARVIDVIGSRCSVRLSGDGTKLTNLKYTGSIPAVGDTVLVDYRNANIPTVLATTSNTPPAATTTPAVCTLPDGTPTDGGDGGLVFPPIIPTEWPPWIPPVFPPFDWPPLPVVPPIIVVPPTIVPMGLLSIFFKNVGVFAMDTANPGTWWPVMTSLPDGGGMGTATWFELTPSGYAYLGQNAVGGNIYRRSIVSGAPAQDVAMTAAWLSANFPPGTYTSQLGGMGFDPVDEYGIAFWVTAFYGPYANGGFGKITAGGPIKTYGEGGVPNGMGGSTLELVKYNNTWFYAGGDGWNPHGLGGTIFQRWNSGLSGYDGGGVATNYLWPHSENGVIHAAAADIAYTATNLTTGFQLARYDNSESSYVHTVLPISVLEFAYDFRQVFACDPSGQVLFAFTPAGMGAGLLQRSTDYGASWTNITANIPVKDYNGVPAGNMNNPLVMNMGTPEKWIVAFNRTTAIDPPPTAQVANLVQVWYTDDFGNAGSWVELTGNLTTVVGGTAPQTWAIKSC